MKKYFYIFLMAVVAIAACSKEQEDSSVKGPKTVHLTFTGSTEGLKTTLDETDWGINWSLEDHITVFAAIANPKNKTFNTTAVTDNNRVATFEGDGEEASTYYALSPAQTGATIANPTTQDDCRITATLNAVQNATAGSFDPQANISVAVAEDYAFHFKNVGAIVSFTIGLDNITDAKLEAIGGEVLSGTAVINPSTAEIDSKDGESSVTLSGGLSNGSTYYFVILPGTYASGFRITLYNNNNEFTSFTKGASVTINQERNNLYLGEFNSASNWKKVFNPEDKVRILGGASTEGERYLSYVGSTNYWNSIQHANVDGYAYNYEIFTTMDLTGGFCFASDNGAYFNIYYENGWKVKQVTTPVAYIIGGDSGVYRIRMTLPKGSFEIKKIESVKFRHQNVDDNQTVLDYALNGTWELNNLTLKKGEASYANRYKFEFNFSDNTTEYYGRWKNTSSNPTAYDNSDYFWVQPADNDPFEPGFKYKSKHEVTTDTYHGDLKLSMNNDGGHYTHKISNVWSSDTIVTGEEITVHGDAIASPDSPGWKMRYSTEFYNANVANSGDRVDNSSTMAYPVGYDYEIFINLNAGQKFYFQTASEKLFAINSSGNAIESIDSANDINYAGVGMNGVYRIRINSSTREVALRRAESARYLQPDRGTNQELTYIGNGIWRGYPVFGWTHPKAWGNSERFKFKFQIFFNETSTWQYYGRYETESVYTSTHLQPLTDTNTLASWDNFLTVENDPDLGREDYQVEYGYCDMYLKLNADGYTYQISNIRQ